MPYTKPAANRGGPDNIGASEPCEISLLEWDAAQAAGHSAGKVARVPRNTEPCSLEALIIGALCGIAMIIGLGVAWHWFVDFVKQNLPAIGG